MKAEFTRFEPCRAGAGLEAALIAVQFVDDGPTYSVWMSKTMIASHIKDFGPLPGFVDAMEAYGKHESKMKGGL